MKMSWRQYLERVLGVILPTSVASLAVANDAIAKESDGTTVGSIPRLRDVEPVPFTTPMRLDGPDQFAGHRSHSSHRSHRSHYSGSSGTYRTPPPAAAIPPATGGSPQNLAPRPGTAGGAATDQGLLVAMRAQLELKRLGHYNGAIDGIVGPETQSALRRFQQSQNLAQSGVLDNSTLSRLGIQP
jgi:His-Xaa-Ser repeat protein HxsA